jgi:hypothetical protein
MERANAAGLAAEGVLEIIGRVVRNRLWGLI